MGTLPLDDRTARTVSQPHTLSDAGFYVPEIDGLRAIAVGTVMLYHLNAALMPGGFIGVDVFFVISGYVVTASLGRDAGRSLLDLLQRFYARRILRIVPALMACLLVTFAFTILFIPNSWLSDTNYKTGLYAFFGMSNFALLGVADSYFAPRPEFNPFTHTWSLAVEEQFYLFFPLIFFAWSRLRNRDGIAGFIGRALLPGLTMASFVFLWWISGVNQEAAFYLLPSRFWELGVGAMLFQVQSSGRARFEPTSFTRLTLALGAALVIVAALFADRQAFPFPWAVPAVAGSLLIIAVVSTAQKLPAWIARFLSSPAMIFVGKISYPLYLWHWPVYTLMRWTVGLQGVAAMVTAIGLSFLFAYLSYTLLETPIRSGSWIRAQRKSLVVAAGLACIVLSWEAAKFAYSKQYRFAQSTVMRESTKWYPDSWPFQRNATRCPVQSTTETIADVSVETMLPNCSDLPRKRLFVVGDSHAGAYNTMFSLLAGHHGIEVRIYSRAGCSFANLANPGTPECRDFVRAAAHAVAEMSSPDDVIFLPALRLHRLGDQSGPYSEDHVIESTFSARAADQRRMAYDEAAELIGHLSKKGASMIIEAPKPVFKSQAYRCSDWFNAGNPACQGGLTMARETLLEYRKPVMSSLSKLSSAFPDLIVWDPFPVLCPQVTCRAVTKNGPLFFDGDHLGSTGNHLLYPHFLAVLQQAWAKF
jgi:peptidoglycan/LPS O-acetylase OafA/YrhL